MNVSTKNEKGTALGIILISILVVLGILPFFYGFETGPMKQGKSTVVLGVYLQTWGLMFLFSYFFSHKTFFLRWLIWLCENFSSPKGRYMAFFYFVLAFGMGSLALIKGLRF